MEEPAEESPGAVRDAVQDQFPSNRDGVAVFVSNGNPPSIQASNPPERGRTRVIPRRCNRRVIMALVASFGQVQYSTTSRARRIVDAWLSTPFEGGRHRRRIDKIRRFEKAHWME